MKLRMKMKGEVIGSPSKPTGAKIGRLPLYLSPVDKKTDINKLDMDSFFTCEGITNYPNV